MKKSAKVGRKPELIAIAMGPNRKQRRANISTLRSRLGRQKATGTKLLQARKLRNRRRKAGCINS